MWISTCRRLKINPYLSPYKNQLKEGGGGKERILGIIYIS
jgi:hypothetical protein